MTARKKKDLVGKLKDGDSLNAWESGVVKLVGAGVTMAFLQLIYSLAGLLLGLTCVIGGIILFIRGVTGATSWTAKFIGAESHISDAPPGVVLFIVGLFIVWVTKYKVKNSSTE